MKLHRLTITLLLIVLAAQSAFSGNRIRVMAQNMQNFMYILPTIGDDSHPASLSNYEDADGRQKKMNAIMDLYFDNNEPADIYCFCEIECSDDILNYIAQNFSSRTGRNYQIISDGLPSYVSDPNDILRKAGFIYDAATVKPHGQSIATGIGIMYTRFMRMQTFEEIASGERFTVGMNHFKAGNRDDLNTDGTTNGQRRIANAESLIKALPNALDPDILLMGDFNCNIDEECLQMLINAGFQEQILRFDPDASIPGWGTSLIDHTFANSTMAEQVKAAYYHPGATYYSNGYNWGKAYSDHEPYVVELELKPSSNTKTYVKTTSVKTGGQYLLVANGSGNTRKLFGMINGSYGNAPALDVEEVDGGITLDTDAQLMTFEDAGSGLYYIKYSNGKYLSNGLKSDGKSYYTTLTPTTLDNAQKYSATKRSDNRFELKNQSSTLIIYYGNPGYSYADNVWATYYNTNNSQQQAPFLYEEKTTPSGINNINIQPAVTTRKVMQNGRLIIVSPSGIRHNLQGIPVK